MKFRALRCPYCKYVWSKRAEPFPVSCPRCKKRFDYPTSSEELEEAEIITASSVTKRAWLNDANKFSTQCKSIDDVLDRMEEL